MPNKDQPDLFQDNELDTTLDTSLIKPWYLSKRFMATAATIIQGMLLTFMGIDLSPEETAQITMLLLGAGTTISGGVALYGIITSKYKVQMRKPKQ